MESAPLYESDDSDDESSVRSSRKQRAEKLISRAVDTEIAPRHLEAVSPPPEKPSRSWLSLSETDAKPAEPETLAKVIEFPAPPAEAIAQQSHVESFLDEDDEEEETDTNTTAETLDNEREIEEVSEDEAAVAYEMMADAWHAENPPDPDASLEDSAAHNAAEQMYDLIGRGVPPAESYETVLEYLDVDPAEVEAEADTDETVEAMEAGITEGNTGEFEPHSTIVQAAEIAPEDSIEENDNEPTAQSSSQAGSAAHAAGTSAGAAATGGSSGATTSGGGSGSHGGGSGSAPPSGPGGFGGPGGPGGPGAGGYGNTANFSPSLINSPNTLPPAPAEQHLDEGSAAGAALLGGIIGYLIGRRRGRIKTEKKLLPIQKKLEKQVEDMRWDIYDKEAKLRKVAAEQAKQKGPVVVERLETAAQKQEKIRPEKPEKNEAVIAAAAAPIVLEKTPASQRQRAPEAEQLHMKQPVPERIGQVLLNVEAPLIARTAARGASEKPKESTPTAAEMKQTNQKTAEVVKLQPNKHVETMNRAELLDLSEKIMVDGTSLRRIYETNLVGEQGLRRLITEHLRGGDIKKVLKREIVEHEIDYERDPAMRDAAPGAGPVAAGGGKAVLNQMVERASAQVTGVNEESAYAAYYKARTTDKTKHQAEHHKDHRLIDIGLAGVIIVLFTLVVIMYVIRG